MLCPGLRSISSMTVPRPGDGMSMSLTSRRPSSVFSPSRTCAMLSPLATCSPTTWYHFTKIASIGTVTPFSVGPMSSGRNFPITARSESCMTSSTTSPSLRASWRLTTLPPFEVKISFSLPVLVFFTTAMGSLLPTGSSTSLRHFSNAHGPLLSEPVGASSARPAGRLRPVVAASPEAWSTEAWSSEPAGAAPAGSVPMGSGCFGTREGQSASPGVQQPASPSSTSSGGSLPMVARLSSSMVSSRTLPRSSPSWVAFTTPGLPARMSTSVPSGFSTVAIASPACTTSPGLTWYFTNLQLRPLSSLSLLEGHSSPASTGRGGNLWNFLMVAKF
mmetsp:Transcript_95753/g.222041  ORF Transcript_95753/g.222041 Transcript_95753/m.222041 type:complete len:332 (+) Transcript_95753:1028-2023(+)